MPTRKRPTPEDAATARRILLDGLGRDADIFELLSELARLHPRDNTFPGEAFLHLAADALDWCGASRRALWLWRDSAIIFCPSAPSMPTKQEAPVRRHGSCGAPRGTEPDLLDEVAWWQTDDFWQCAMFATVAYIRAAASRAGVPVRQACQQLAERSGDTAT